MIHQKKTAKKGINIIESQDKHSKILKHCHFLQCNYCLLSWKSVFNKLSDLLNMAYRNGTEKGKREKRK